MTIHCLDCQTPVELPDDALFAPRLCEPCRLKRLGAADHILTRDREASETSRKRALLEVLAAKLPSPNNPDRFDQPTWNEIKAWRWRADKQPILLLYGQTGKRKTRMVVQACIDHATDTEGITIDWWGGMELKAAILQTYAKGVNSHTLDGLRSQLARASWLVIDDWLSHAKATASHGEFLLSVLDERIARHRPTLITMQAEATTNDRQDITRAVEAQFEGQLTGEAVARRVHAHACIISPP